MRDYLRRQGGIGLLPILSPVLLPASIEALTTIIFQYIIFYRLADHFKSLISRCCDDRTPQGPAGASMTHKAFHFVQYTCVAIITP